MSGRVLGVIPARLSSTRLPRKPLQFILGRPLIEWVWERAREIDALDDVIVATDSEEIARVCTRAGAAVMMTSSMHPSGTDRVAEVARAQDEGAYGVIVNVQGDEPLVHPDHVAAAVALVRDAGWEVGTCATPLVSPRAYLDPSVVKVIRSTSGQGLYFSRAAVPHSRDHEPGRREFADAPFLRHVGLYAYTPDALARWVALPPSPLEELEKLEQLRPLEHGIGIGIAIVEDAERGIDTPDDVLRVEARLRELGKGPFARSAT